MVPPAGARALAAGQLREELGSIAKAAKPVSTNDVPDRSPDFAALGSRRSEDRKKSCHPIQSRNGAEQRTIPFGRGLPSGPSRMVAETAPFRSPVETPIVV